MGLPEQRLARLEGMLRSMDANGDGILDPREIPEDRRRFLGFLAARIGLHVDGPIPIGQIRQAVAERMGGGGDQGGQHGKSAPPEPLVPGFGVEQDLPPVLGFGQRAETAATTGHGPSPGSDRSGRGGRFGAGSPDERQERVRRFAEMMLRRYDRDGSGKLERNEWDQIRGDPREIDRDGNGVITRDEFMERVSQYVRSRMGGRGGDGDRGGSHRPGGDVEPTRQKRSYRFLAPTERLPEGLPQWFVAHDADGDGQVTMAEYAGSWTDSKAREFAQYDLNNDGLVTPGECLKAASRPELAAPPSGPPGSEPAVAPAQKKPAGKSGGEKPWWMS